MVKLEVKGTRKVIAEMGTGNLTQKELEIIEKEFQAVRSETAGKIFFGFGLAGLIIMMGISLIGHYGFVYGAFLGKAWKFLFFGLTFSSPVLLAVTVVFLILLFRGAFLRRRAGELRSPKRYKLSVWAKTLAMVLYFIVAVFVLLGLIALITKKSIVINGDGLLVLLLALLSGSRFITDLVLALIYKHRSKEQALCPALCERELFSV